MKNRLNEYIKAYHPIVHILMLGGALISLTSAMSLIYLPIYLMNQTHLDPMMVGLIVGAGALTATVGGYIGGTLSDLFGRNRFLLFSLIALSAVFFGFVLTAQPILLFVINMFRGLFSAFFVTISKALMGDLTPKEKRLRAFSNRYLSGNIGFSLGPIIGIFFGMAGNGAAFLLTACIYIVYFLLLATWIGVTRFTEVEEEKSEKVPFSQTFKTFWKDKALLVFIVGSITLTAVHGEMSVTLSQYLKMNFVTGVKLFGYLMSINGVTVILMQVWVTRWTERYRLFTRIAMGSLLFALGEMGFAFSGNALGFIISMIVFTFGEILIIPSEYAQIDEITPEGMRGMYYGAQGFSEMGNFIGPWLGGLILMSYGGKAMFLTFALLCFIGIAFYAWGRKLYQRRQGLNKKIA